MSMLNNTIGMVIHFGSSWEALCATSIIKGLHNRYDNLKLDWATNNDNYDLIKYNKKLENIFIDNCPVKQNYDFVIDLSQNERSKYIIDKISSYEYIVSNDSSVKYYINGERVDKHILKIIFRMANLRWKGEGYDLSYYPRNKTKKSKTGVAIVKRGLRSYIENNLELNFSDIWQIPMKKNLLKRIDEINRCKRVVTDDLFTVHVSIALRKHVEFLDTEGFCAEIEFFGQGNHVRLNNEKWIL